MRNKENEKYFKWGLTALIVIALAILYANKVFNSNGEPGALSLLLMILRPFVFGGVIAYLVTPLANWLDRLFGSKARGLANILALVIAILIVLGVILLIVPQVVGSIVEIAKSIPEQVKVLQEKFSAYVSQYTSSHPEQADFVNNTVRDVIGWFNALSATFSTAGTIIEKVKPVLAGSASKVTGVFGALKDLMIGTIVILLIYSFLSSSTKEKKEPKKQ